MRQLCALRVRRLSVLVFLAATGSLAGPPAGVLDVARDPDDCRGGEGEQHLEEEEESFEHPLDDEPCQHEADNCDRDADECCCR